jgi:hypothetical protein
MTLVVSYRLDSGPRHGAKQESREQPCVQDPESLRTRAALRKTVGEIMGHHAFRSIWHNSGLWGGPVTLNCRRGVSRAAAMCGPCSVRHSSGAQLIEQLREGPTGPVRRSLTRVRRYSVVLSTFAARLTASIRAATS